MDNGHGPTFLIFKCYLGKGSKKKYGNFHTFADPPHRDNIGIHIWLGTCYSTTI